MKGADLAAFSASDNVLERDIRRIIGHTIADTGASDPKLIAVAGKIIAALRLEGYEIKPVPKPPRGYLQGPNPEGAS